MATNQFGFRGRNDDGNETTATWKANENTNWTQRVDTNFRVRFKMQNDTAALNNLDVKLQYNLSAAGWVDVSATSNVVRSSASPNLADAANLTEQLTGGTGTFIGATAFDEVNGICGGNSLDVTATGKFEVEYCVQIRSADVTNGATLQLRTINSDTGTAWGTYGQTPTITVLETTTIAQPGTSDGLATVTGVGRATIKAAGSSTGASTASAEGEDAAAGSTIEGDGLSTGTATATAVGQGINKAAGSSTGVATATADGQATIKAAASSTATAAAAAIARAFALGGGSASAISTAAAIAQAINKAVASSAGLATVGGVGRDAASEPDLPVSVNGVVPVFETTGGNVVPVYETTLAANVVPVRVGSTGVPVQFVSAGRNIIPVARVQ